MRSGTIRLAVLTGIAKPIPIFPPLVEKIWDYTDDRRFTINELYRQNAVCELKIYQVVSEMLRIGQIATVHPTPQPQPQAPPELAKAS